MIEAYVQMIKDCKKSLYEIPENVRKEVKEILDNDGVQLDEDGWIII